MRRSGVPQMLEHVGQGRRKALPGALARGRVIPDGGHVTSSFLAVAEDLSYPAARPSI